MSNLFDLTGKKAIVTGAAAGLGKGISEGLHEAGAEVVLVDISQDVLQTAEEIGKSGPPTKAIISDLGNREVLNKSFDEAQEHLGRVDILVNSAGIQRRHKCEDFPMGDWDAVLEINLTAGFQLCQLAGREMLKNGYGKIINIASMQSFNGGLTIPAYAASKGAIAQLTKSLSNEWAAKNVNVNAIAPGYMATDLNVALIGNPDREPEIMGRVPIGRWGQPDDIKGAAIFLASAASDFINGIVLPVDGGYLGR